MTGHHHRSLSALCADRTRAVRSKRPWTEEEAARVPPLEGRQTGRECPECGGFGADGQDEHCPDCDGTGRTP